MSKIEVDTIDTQSSTTLQVGSTNTSLIKIGTSGDTVEYPAGTTFTQSGTQNVTAGGAINVKSGGSIIIESGAAITNNGTATGFSADLTKSKTQLIEQVELCQTHVYPAMRPKQ